MPATNIVFTSPSVHPHNWRVLKWNDPQPDDTTKKQVLAAIVSTLQDLEKNMPASLKNACAAIDETIAINQEENRRSWVQDQNTRRTAAANKAAEPHIAAANAVLENLFAAHPEITESEQGRCRENMARALTGVALSQQPAIKERF